jgi:hypothetical protein
LASSMFIYFKTLLPSGPTFVTFLSLFQDM